MTTSTLAHELAEKNPSRVVLVRHGQTDWNFEHRFQGQVDIPLNETGREQAQQAARNLEAFAEEARTNNPQFAWDEVVTSPLSRAHETGQIIAHELGIKVTGTYDGMKERSFGEAEGEVVTHETWSEMEELYSGIEPLEDLRVRGIAALNTAIEEHSGKNLIIVAHGMWISQVLTELTGEEIEIPANAVATELPLELFKHTH